MPGNILRFLMMVVLLSGCGAPLPLPESAPAFLTLPDGSPFFPVGVYHFPERRTDDVMLQEAIAAGVNMVVEAPGQPPALRRSYNLPARRLTDGKTRHTVMDLLTEPDSALAALDAFIAEHDTAADHLIWQGPDEPNYFPFSERRYPSPEGLLTGYRRIRDRSRHPVWTNLGPTGTVNAPRDMESNRPYLPSADVWSLDMYPVPLSQNYQESPFADLGLAQIGRLTRALRDLLIEQGRQTKPVWMVLQGFGWGDVGRTDWQGVPPTREEIRFMTYDALINGASGILYWGVNYNKAESEYWGLLKGLTRELADLIPALTAPAAAVEAGHPAIEATARQWNDDLVVLAANTSGDMHTGVAIRVAGKFDIPAAVLFEARTLSMSGAAITDDFRPHEVHVYRMVGGAR